MAQEGEHQAETPRRGRRAGRHRTDPPRAGQRPQGLPGARAATGCGGPSRELRKDQPGRGLPQEVRRLRRRAESHRQQEPESGQGKTEKQKILSEERPSGDLLQRERQAGEGLQEHPRCGGGQREQTQPADLGSRRPAGQIRHLDLVSLPGFGHHLRLLQKDW